MSIFTTTTFPKNKKNIIAKYSRNWFQHERIPAFLFYTIGFRHNMMFSAWLKVFFHYPSCSTYMSRLPVSKPPRRVRGTAERACTRAVEGPPHEIGKETISTFSEQYKYIVYQTKPVTFPNSSVSPFLPGRIRFGAHSFPQGDGFVAHVRFVW